MQSQTMPKINLLKMPDPAAQTAKYVNMMNATKQQEAAERQAAVAQETLKLQQERARAKKRCNRRLWLKEKLKLTLPN
jgi:hypothetical protein